MMRRCLVLLVFTACLFSALSANAANVRLNDFARQYAFRTSYTGKFVSLTNRYHSFRFELNSRRAEYNGVSIWLSTPVVMEQGRWMLNEIDANKFLHPLLNPNRTLKAARRERILLDPGHGGEDQGASGRSRWATEKRLNLDIALRVQALLAPDCDVTITRTTDRTMSLENRCELARNLKADLFISIHLNASTVTTASGIETHILTLQNARSTASSSASASDNIRYSGNSFDGPNAILGYTLQRHLLLRTTAEDRGVRRSRFFVLRNAPCPAVLLECGFLSNRAEENKLMTAKYRETIARGIADGITTYLAAIKRASVLAR